MDKKYRHTARAFRTTVPSGNKEDEFFKEVTHTVSLTYPPDEDTLSKIKYLRRYKSFIHEARIFSKDASSSVKEIYDSLIPQGCTLQYLQVEYEGDTRLSTMDVRSLYKRVSSIHIKIKHIREDDVFRAMSAVRHNDDFGIKISGWHQFDKKYIEFAQEATKESLKSTKESVFNYEIGTSYLVFWSEEMY